MMNASSFTIRGVVLARFGIVFFRVITTVFFPF